MQYDPYMDGATPEERELQLKLDDAQDWMEGVIEHAYSTGDRDAFENALEEVAGILGLWLPESPLKL